MGCELLAKGDDRVVGGAACGWVEASGCCDAAVAIGTAAAIDGGVDLKADGGGVRQRTLLDQPGLLKALAGVVIGALRNETLHRAERGIGIVVLAVRMPTAVPTARETRTCGTGVALSEEYLDFLLGTAESATVEGVDAQQRFVGVVLRGGGRCLLYTSPSPRDRQKSRMPSSA